MALYEIDASVDYTYVLRFLAKTENNPWFYKNPATSVIKLIEKVYASFPANVQPDVISKFAGNLGAYGTSVTESPYLIDFILSRGGYDKFLTSNLGIYEIRGINRSFGKTLAYKDVMHRFIQRGYNAKTFRYLSFFDHTALADYCGSDYPSLLKFLKSEQLVDKMLCATLLILRSVAQIIRTILAMRVKTLTSTISTFRLSCVKSLLT